MTTEQNKAIFTFLSGRNLPLDLIIEIMDHMVEQISYKMDFEDKNFESAFEETKAAWKEDLTEKRFLNVLFKKRTKIQIKTQQLTSNKIIRRAILYFLPIFISIILALLISRKLTYDLILFFNACAITITILMSILNIKIVRRIWKRNKKNII